MSGRRPFRPCMTAFLVVLSLLFSQLALAGYVCPRDAGAVSVAAMEMAEGESCEGMDAAQPVLCHQHAADMSLSFEPAKLTTPSLPAIVQVLLVPLVLAAQDQALPQQARPERQHPPPDPVFLATLRLRV
jgi:hypothetical protein